MTEGGVNLHSRKSYLKKKERKQKEARIIVRNLPFKITEDKLKEHFEQYGEVVDTNLLRKGQKLVGCGFVQFDKKISAAKAIANASGKPLLGRVVIADWAIPKKKFLVSTKPEVKTEIKEEVLSDSEIKVEPSDEDKEESESSDSEDEDRVSRKRRKGQASDSEDESENSDEDSDEDDDEDEEESDDEDDGEEKPAKKRRVYDVLEGRTVFIKNVPFSATEEDLEASVKKFGPIYYAKICVDPITEHPKGTAFVKFHSKESADSCLAAGTEFQLDGTVLDPHPALAKNIIRKQEQTKQKKQQRDSRNLYLLKEGVVRAGSEAAEGVSEGDMAKRLQLEKWKREVIKDLGRFVSPLRLVIQNLPATLSDARLRALAKRHAPPTAKVSEARVMRDLKSRDAQGTARSKEFGFLSFTKHEDALACLRNLNNNPTVFRRHRRPIVSFSLENRNALKIKQMRLEASRKPKEAREDKVKTEGVKVEGVKVEGKKKAGKKGKNVKNVELIEEEKKEEKFAGARATPGTKKYQNSLNIKKEAVTHRTALKKAKAKNKARKKARIRTKAKETKTGPNTAKDNDTNFSKLVEKYKTQISEASSKSKWYD